MLSATGALLIAAGLLGLAGLGWWGAGRWRAFVPYAREAAFLCVLYAGWQGLLDVLATGTSGATARGRWLWVQERRFHLPSEAWVQHLLSHGPLMRGAGVYYAGVHFVGMGLFLLWVFVRHRDRYRQVRGWLVVFTGLAAFVQAVPVAPPRLVPGLGVVDAAARYGLSVYPSGGIHDPGQLVAMPSVHVGWAALIALGTLRLGRGPWRWIGPVHLALTVVVVVATGNHYWADGLAALALVAVAVGVTPVTGGTDTLSIETTGREDRREGGAPSHLGRPGRRPAEPAGRPGAGVGVGLADPSLGPGPGGQRGRPGGQGHRVVDPAGSDVLAGGGTGHGAV